MPKQVAINSRPPRRLLTAGRLGPWPRPRKLSWIIDLRHYGTTYRTTRGDSGRPVVQEVQHA